MRRLAGIAGATLIYGKGEQFPDMILALQFLLDDLRREGRQISGVRLSGHTLRLRVEDFELAASLAPEPLPVTAFHGVLRPPRSGSDTHWTHDLARGRLLHAIRHHRWALGVLLRARWRTDPGNDGSELDLSSECRTVVAALVEASPPQFILWQASGVLFTLAEFQAMTPQRLNAPGAPGSAMHPKPAPIAPATRPVMPGWRGPEAACELREHEERPRSAIEVRDCGGLPAVTAERDHRRSRSDRVLRRSAGKVFKRAEDSQRPPELLGLDRSHRRLARAFERQEPASASDRSRRTPNRWLRPLGCVLLAISLIFILPPLAGV